MNFQKNILVKISIAVLFFQFLLIAQSDSLFQEEMEWEAFPIFNYDSDAGYGYGGKGFLYNIFGRKESFDLTLYNSTKGERWYRFVFSIIDMQRRQGKKYPIALDLIIDYDKWINYKYYSRIFDYPTNKIKVKSTSYKREAIEITALLSKGFVKDFIAELGVRFKSVNSSDFNPAGNDFNFYSVDYFSVRPRSYIQLASLIFNFKWDTRINYINPESGFVLEIDNEIAYDILNPPGQNFYKIGFLSQHYVKLFAPHFIFANRVILQAISEVDYQLLLPLGGNKTIRGLPQDRYLSESTILFNSELRFPIWRRLGGIAGVDIGNSETTPDWLINPVVGLRFYMDNFVVRFDVGFGKEITGIYFNFGHIF